MLARDGGTNDLSVSNPADAGTTPSGRAMTAAADAEPGERSAAGAPSLRRGWTTGACAAAATRAACEGLMTSRFPDPVSIDLPGGLRPAFALAREARGAGWAAAGVVKDAGDDPDVTHGALVTATVRRGAAGAGVTFRAGEGVGTVTRPGLALAVGEPAINPAPRAMIRATVGAAARAHGASGDMDVEIGIENGAALAERTMNGRLGIVGGLSVLGTTGVVVPYSCAAWIAAIHRGIDVARAAGHRHVAAATGRTSEAAVRARYRLPETALIDMGDFAGGVLKYLRRRPVPRLSLAGGFAKLCKLAQGNLDLHSARSRVDPDWLAERAAATGAAPETVAAVRAAPSAGAALTAAPALASDIAAAARAVAQETAGPDVAVEVLIYDRAGRLRAGSGF